MFIKSGEAIEINRIEDASSCIPAVSEEILDNFRKFAANLKKIAPKAEDFLYFSGIMMHAAEASAINEDGSIKMTLTGQPVKVGWDKSNNTWKWTTNDPSVKPYKNCNGDIFPEEELIKAYKKWVGKPLCIDHKSSSVDHVRGFIVDAYYDRNLKRVVALCALDKKNYPDLARKISTGYSRSLSMGTAVGRAICSDCARVARTEDDFCDHMKRKNCYGEINIDLNPIELSIVVNGADPKAHIKHIIASANTLNSYVDMKEKELNKIAARFGANIYYTLDHENGESTSIQLNASNIEDLKKDINAAIKQLENINSSLKNTEGDNNSAFNQSSGTLEMQEGSIPNTDFGLAPPSNRYASTDNVEAGSINELKVVTASIEAKLNQMKKSLDSLVKTSTNIQEDNMSESNINKQGYFQGAGGVNEPTPGQAKYTKDPTNEKLREDGDKHMLVDDTGPVDGLHPGPSSVGMSELERKKMLARAEAEERAMRRNSVVELAKKALETKKEAYFQGGGGVNEPSLGKTKYPADKLQDDLREKSDKHMVGQKPFPGVGNVDNLHPSPNSADVSDEKKRKELLQRASLRARFVKASNEDGSQNLGKCAWEVFLGDKLLLTASVNDLSGNRAESLYDKIATKEFGSKLIENVKTFGADRVRLLVKSAQQPAEAAPAPAPAPAASAPEAAPEPAALEPMMPEDTGKSGDPKENAMDLSEKVRDLSSDLVEAVRALTGEQAEMGNEVPEEPVATAEASDSRTLNALRREINGALIQAMKESIAELNDHENELSMIVDVCNKGAVSNKEFLNSITEDALNDAKTAVADGLKLMTAFVKYAHGTKAIVRRAEIEAELDSLADEGEDMDYNEDSSDMSSEDNLSALIDETDSELSDLGDEMGEDYSLGLEDESLEGESLEDESLGAEEDYEEESEDLESLYSDDNDVVMTPEEASKLKPETKLDVKLTSLEERSALRAKLAAEALKTSPHLHEAHPKKKVTTDLDVKPSDDLAVIENLEEVHDAVMDLAKAPPNVRKEAEEIHKLISEGKLDPSDLDNLVAEGLDKDAVAYYKKYWGQVDGGSEFANELVKEHVKAEMEKELNNYRIKLARAYELAYEMVDRQLLPHDRGAISDQVDQIMNFNDANFEALKRVVAKSAPVLRREASRIPQVGVVDSFNDNNTSSDNDNLVAQLSAAFSKTSRKMF